jgi:general stress protein YciG
VNAEDTVQTVDDESGQRDDNQDREHEPEAGEQTGQAAPFGRPACGLLVSGGALGRQRLRPRLGGRHGRFFQFLNLVRRVLN